MRTSIPRRRLSLIDRIIVAARGKRGSPRADLLRSYFIGVDEEDLAARPPLEALALAARHVALAERRRRGETLIEVLAPQPAPAGKRPVSQVLIVTDDRPFLVDSIGLAFARAGVGVHTLIHPVMQVERDRRDDCRARWPQTRHPPAVRNRGNCTRSTRCSMRRSASRS